MSSVTQTVDDSWLALEVPLERANLFETLAAGIEELILSGKLKSGARLPSEEAIAKQYGVSRPVVREALARLRDRGLVSTISGRGTFVQQANTTYLSEAFLRHLRRAAVESGSVRNLYEARIAIEGMTASLAATRSNAADREQIRRHLDAMSDARGDTRRWTAADIQFHLAIAAASHNPFLLALLDPLGKAIERTIRESYRTPEAVERALKAHEGVLLAVEAGDGEAAREVMRQHLLDSQRYFSEQLASTSSGRGEPRRSASSNRSRDE
jgi:GntR family transcriptional repressor for pyruvate dehydrogenase complex